MSAECAFCHSSFVPKWGKVKTRYCSSACAGKAKRGICFEKTSERVCVVCSVTYQGNLRSKYCGQKCREFGSKAGARGFISHLLKRTSRKALTVEYVMALYEQQNGCCAITGIQMTIDPGRGRTRTNVSIDRIDSQKGYEHGNIQLVCLIINLMKLHLSTEEFLYWCSAAVGSFDKQRLSA